MVATDFDSVVRKPGRLIGINPATIYDGSAPLAMLMKSIDSEGSTSRSRGQPPDPCLNLNLVADPAQPLGFFRHLGGGGVSRPALTRPRIPQTLGPAPPSFDNPAPWATGPG
jgi:hypothetical protein